MKFKTFSTVIILVTLPMTETLAASLDRSGQSISAFLQPGNYFEAGISILDPNVSGKVRNEYSPNATPPSVIGLQNTNISDMGDDYYSPSAALKLQVTDNFSFGLIYDRPFGADVTYSLSDPASAAAGGLGLFHNGTESLEVEVKTQSISMLLGYQPNENFNFYAGPVYQTIEGDAQFRGLAFGGNNSFGGYNLNIKETGGVGWLGGIAYQIPEIALKASVTYRSEIDHEMTINESSIATLGQNIGTFINMNNGLEQTKIITPQSVNLDFQTGIMANTVAFANARWVNWKDFTIRPYAFGVASEIAGPSVGKPNGFDLAAYSDDQWSANIGIGRKLNDQWTGNISVGWDSGAGNLVTALGPTEGYWNLGLGAQFSPTPQTFISGGVKYFWLGDAKLQTSAQFNTPNYVAEFKDNHAIAYGLKMGYKF